MKPPQTVIALTGGIGSGKSLVARLFADWGAVVVDADDLAREVVAPGSLGLTKTVEAFGTEILTKDGSLDRAKLAALIFSNERARKQLEQILHPLIRQTWLARLADLQGSCSAPIIVYTLPLFYESGQHYPEISQVVHVSAPDEIRIARTIARDRCSEASVRDRMKAQLSDEEKNTRADFVIINDGSLEDLARRSRDVFESLLQSAL
jgi:dephospho-CoA kinase